MSAQCPAEDPALVVQLPDPNDCSSFCKCYKGTAYEVHCPAGTYYDPEILVCNWASMVGNNIVGVLKHSVLKYNLLMYCCIINNKLLNKTRSSLVWNVINLYITLGCLQVDCGDRPVQSS